MARSSRLSPPGSASTNTSRSLNDIDDSLRENRAGGYPIARRQLPSEGSDRCPAQARAVVDDPGEAADHSLGLGLMPMQHDQAHDDQETNQDHRGMPVNGASLCEGEECHSHQPNQEADN